jgi:Flp pilus assembly protein TadG
MSRVLRCLVSDTRGSVAVEFGLLGPLMIGMLLAVLQIGIGMHSYNALRAISGDVARYAVVQYQTNNNLSNTQLRDYARSVATRTPYGLDETAITINVSDAGTQRVADAKELELEIVYQVPSLLTIMGIDSPSINFTRPIFLID